MAMGVVALVALAACNSEPVDDGMLHVRVLIPDGYQGPAVIWFPNAPAQGRRGKTETLKRTLPANGLLEVDTDRGLSAVFVHWTRKNGSEIKGPIVSCNDVRTFLAGSGETITPCNPAMLSPGSRGLTDPKFVVRDRNLAFTDSAHAEEVHNATWELLHARYKWLDSADRYRESGARR